MQVGSSAVARRRRSSKPLRETSNIPRPVGWAKSPAVPPPLAKGRERFCPRGPVLIRQTRVGTALCSSRGERGKLGPRLCPPYTATSICAFCLRQFVTVYVVKFYIDFETRVSHKC